MKVKVIHALLLFGMGTFFLASFASADGTLEPLGEKIQFKLIEGYDSSQPLNISSTMPTILMTMKTEKKYPNANYLIKSDIDVDIEKKIIGIDIVGIFIPDLTLPAEGPAFNSAFLRLTNGDYVLSLKNRGTTDRYRVAVDDQKIKIDYESSSGSRFTVPETRVMNRYPTDSFVYLCGTMIKDKHLCDEILQELKYSAEIREFKFLVGESFPYPPSSGGHGYDMPARFFTYKDQKDFEIMGGILRDYNSKVLINYKGVGISLINWRNRKYLSWMF